MCGIAAVTKFDGSPVAAVDLRRMCSAIAHRGPDGAGFAVVEDRRVGLGHVRLSIVDLDNGAQPIFNEDGNVAVVCNGEIYDFRRTRRELQRAGHRFATGSDSEVLVHLYEQHGVDAFSRLNGEFAAVIWDGRSGEVVAVRDRAGVKPLYYRHDDGELLIASEAKAILALPRVPRRLSNRFLTGAAFGTYTADACAFEGVHCLMPGHVLVARPNGGVVTREYHRQSFEPDRTMSFADAKRGVRERLEAAVERRLVADVPVHAYLSGGVDSTIVAGLMARAGHDFTAFNLSFPDSPYDESAEARAIAERFGIAFESVPAHDDEIAGNIAKAVYHVETSLPNYNSVAKLLLSEFVSWSGVKVCLTGEGADEMFAGYPFFRWEMLLRMQEEGGESAVRARKLTKSFRAAERRSAGYLWDDSRRLSRARLPGHPSFLQFRARRAGGCVRTLLNCDSLGITRAERPETQFRHSFDLDELARLDPLNATRRMTLQQLYALVIPALGDRVEMAHALECRTPFLDADLMEFAGRIPPVHLVDETDLREKHVLREAFADLLPPRATEGRKHAFLSPSWRTFAARPAGRELFDEQLSTRRLREVGIYRPAAVRAARLMWNVLPAGSSMARQVDALMGMLVTVHLLHDRFVERSVPCDPAFAMEDRSPVREERLVACATVMRPGSDQSRPSGSVLEHRTVGGVESLPDGRGWSVPQLPGAS